jgi:RNA polymerase sigma factor (sigma-70 family)
VEQGDVGAAGQRRRWALVLPHRGYLVGIAVRRGMSWHDAEDCAQEAMARCAAFEGLDETRVVEFLVSTTMRLCVDRHRLRTRDERVGAKLVPWYLDEPSPEESACDRDEAAWVAAHIAALPASQRDALAAKAEGLSCAEIAARMGLSYKAVESLLSRARTYVRASIASAYALLLGMIARRRAVTSDPAVSLSVVALAAAAMFAVAPVPGMPAAGAETPEAVRAGAAVRVPSTAPATAVRAWATLPRPGAGGSVPQPSLSPPPAAPVTGGGPLKPLKPLDPCDDVDLSHVSSCVPFASYVPGEGAKNCLRYGVDISPQGFKCRDSRDPNTG